MSRYRQILQDYDETEELNWLDNEIALIELGERSSKRSQPDPRQMDEILFWGLIKKARTTSDSIARQMEALSSDLSNFKASEIKNFQKLLDEKMCEAYHWDLWALAYIAQGGCSDDGFVDFRAWLILQGQEFFKLALTDIRKVLDEVPWGQGAQVEGLQGVAGVAYEWRTGKSLLPGKVPPCRLKGVAWKVQDLEILYPEVYKHYRL
jgi:hypothetical protein